MTFSKARAEAEMIGGDWRVACREHGGGV